MSACSTNMVQSKYFPKKELKPPIDSYAIIHNISTANIQGERLHICVAGDLILKTNTEDKYIPVSIYKTENISTIPQSDNNYAASINTQTVQKHARNNAYTHIQSASVSPICNNITPGIELKIINIRTSNKRVYSNMYSYSSYDLLRIEEIQEWLSTNIAADKFIVNLLYDNESLIEPIPISSTYIQHSGDGYIATTFKIETYPQLESPNKLTGILLYPFAVVFDVITFPIQLIIGLFFLGGMA